MVYAGANISGQNIYNNLHSQITISYQRLCLLCQLNLGHVDIMTTKPWIHSIAYPNLHPGDFGHQGPV